MLSGRAVVVFVAACVGATACSSSTSLASFWSERRLAHAHPLIEAHATEGRETEGQSHPARGRHPRVGGLFFENGGGAHFCTASVVDSPHGNLILTAAHCVYGDGAFQHDIAFVPEYHDGDAPHGVWQPEHVVVDARWTSSSDPDDDVAFIVLRPLDGRNVADVVGANRLRFDPPFGRPVRITGYPSNAEAPITCVSHATEHSPTQMRVACTGFEVGTSGSPWVDRFNSRTLQATIIGVIGGYQEGGATDDVSYSPYFGARIEALYERAVAES